jgi:hypothetical protein
MTIAKVFLGGTCNNSDWRDQLIPMLRCDYFNPVVAEWTLECLTEEIRQRDACDICLYTITPKMTGFYSIAEVVEDSMKRPDKTVLCVLDEDDGLVFTEAQMKSLRAVGAMVKENTGRAPIYNLHDLAEYLNSRCGNACN